MVAAAELSRTINWFASPPDTLHSTAAMMLTDIWVQDAGFGQTIARMPWVGDGIADDEGSVLVLLRDIAVADPTVAKRTAESLLSPEGVTEREGQALERFLQEVVGKDVEIATAVSGYSWFTDGVTPREWEAIEVLVSPVRDNPAGMRAIALLPWVTDGVTTLEGESVASLQRVARHSGLFDRVLGYDWVTVDTNYFEQQGLEYLGAIAESDPGLAMAVAEKPWFVDGVTYHEQIGVLYLSYVARRDPALAQHVADSIPGGRRAADLVIALGRMAAENPQEFGQLRGQPWVVDGLNSEERAFIIMLQDAAHVSPSLFTDFLESHYARSSTVTAPASGEMRLWVFQSTPFPSNDDTLESMEEAVLGIDELLGLPFVTNDIIAMVVPASTEARDGTPFTAHVGSHIRLIREGANLIPKYFVYHETGHYFFGILPIWIVEGGAELVDAYIRDRKGVESIEDELHSLEGSLDESCYRQGIPNLLELGERDSIYTDAGPLRCSYVFGKYFFLSLHQLIGKEALSSVLREMHNRFTGTELDVRLRGKDIYQISLNHTPPEKEAEYRDLFRRLHGGPWPDANTNVPDDHSDDATAATVVQTGAVTEGVLAHEFDTDYFRFQPEAAHDYHIAVDQESEEDIRLRLYAADGITLLAVRETEVEGAGVLFSWVAPGSGAYHIAVDSPVGSIDTYTLAIRPVVIGADNHGDEPSTATSVALGEIVHGAMDHRLDLDYFRFQAETGQAYEVVVTNDNLNFSRVRLYGPDGVSPVRTYAEGWGRKGSQLCVISSDTSEYYAAVESPMGNSGAYTLQILTTTPCEE